jgi:hypothetical protein
MAPYLRCVRATVDSPSLGLIMFCLKYVTGPYYIFYHVQIAPEICMSGFKGDHFVSMLHDLRFVVVQAWLLYIYSRAK